VAGQASLVYPQGANTLVALGYTGRRYVRKKGRKKEKPESLKALKYCRCGPAFDAQVRPLRYTYLPDLLSRLSDSAASLYE